MAVKGIYVAGPAGAGKSTAARYIAGRLGDRARVYRMAEPVRAAAARRKMDWSDRSSLQAAADEVRLLAGADYLARALLAAASRLPDGAVPVADGVRLPEEAAALRAAGWAGVLVDAPFDVRLARLVARDGERAARGDWWKHRTETAARDVPVDAAVENAGTLDDFFAALEAVLKDLAGAVPAGG